MTEEIFWTITFGLVATAIGIVTIWQTFQIVEIKREVMAIQHKLTTADGSQFLGHDTTLAFGMVRLCSRNLACAQMWRGTCL